MWPGFGGLDTGRADADLAWLSASRAATSRSVRKWKPCPRPIQAVTVTTVEEVFS